MEMLENCIDKIFEKSELSDNEGDCPHVAKDKELYKSIYYHLCDYRDVLNKSIELGNEIGEISKRWELVKKANDCHCGGL